MYNNETYAGYLFVYFIDDRNHGGEEVYFALSEENDPLHWRELNGGRPVLTSELGEKGVRDPFIVRSLQGDKFYLIATDLNAHGDGDWERAEWNGSRSIMVWESPDLITWSKQRSVEIAPQDAGCTWAPECFIDHCTGEYIVFWASSFRGEKEQNGYHRMMFAKTRDFVSFTSPEILLDYGYSIIDTTVIEHQGKVYRFSKGKHVMQESGHSFFDTDYLMINENIEESFMQRGEGPIIFKSNIEEKWHLFIDEFGMRGYVPLETTDLDSGVWTMPEQFSLPTAPRHGGIISVTAAEYVRLLENYS